MARIIFCLPSQDGDRHGLFTNLDFWDARRILGDLAPVRRNFSQTPPGDDYPTLVVDHGMSLSAKKRVAYRLGKAVASPPRHVIVREMLSRGAFEFDPLKYYPGHWTPARMIHFTYHRLPLQQSALNTPYLKVQLTWEGGKIRAKRIRREGKYDPVIKSRKASERRLRVPSCF